MKSFASEWTYNLFVLLIQLISASVAAVMVRSRNLDLPRYDVLTITYGDSSRVKKMRRYPNSNQSWTEEVGSFDTNFLLCTMILSVFCSCHE